MITSEQLINKRKTFKIPELLNIFYSYDEIYSRITEEWPLETDRLNKETYYQNWQLRVYFEPDKRSIKIERKMNITREINYILLTFDKTGKLNTISIEGQYIHINNYINIMIDIYKMVILNISKITEGKLINIIKYYIPLRERNYKYISVNDKDDLEIAIMSAIFNVNFIIKYPGIKTSSLPEDLIEVIKSSRIEYNILMGLFNDDMWDLILDEKIILNIVYMPKVKIDDRILLHLSLIPSQDISWKLRDLIYLIRTENNFEDIKRLNLDMIKYIIVRLLDHNNRPAGLYNFWYRYGFIFSEDDDLYNRLESVLGMRI